MKPRRVVALFAIFVIFWFVAPAYSHASQVRIVRLSQVDGKVYVERPASDQEKAVLNMPIVQGMRVIAEDDSAVEIEFENGSTLRMVGPAIATFRELSMRDEGDRVSQIEIEPGTYYFNITHKSDDDFRVMTLNHELRVKKSSRFRVIGDAGESKVAVFKGQLELDGRGEEVSIKKNETLTLNEGMEGKYFLGKGTEPDPNDAWDKERDQYRDSYAKAESWKYANLSYGGPYSYGFTDLNYYGNFFSVPGYGWMWRPAYFGPSWDPFDNGAWMFYPGQGWMFISMYPWGWTPYRYGQWLWLPGYGWCWRPVRSYTYWNAQPVIRSHPGGWYQPTPPPGSAWTRTVFVNPRPTTKPTPGAWHRPTIPTAPVPVQPTLPTQPIAKRPPNPHVDGKVVERQPDVIDPRVRGNDDWRTGKTTNDPRPVSPKRDMDMPKSGMPRVQPKPTPPAPVDRTPAPVVRTPSPKTDTPRVTPPRMEAPQPTPPPKADAPKSAPPGGMDAGRIGGFGMVRPAGRGK